MTRGKRGEKHFILKAGFALFLSLAGFFASRRHSRRRALSLLPPPHIPLLISDEESEPGSSFGVLDEEAPIHQTEEPLAKIRPRAHVTLEDNPFPSSESSEVEEEFPWPVQQSPETVPETIPAAPLTDEIKESPAMEKEFKNLRNLVQGLQERETCLEMQLLECHGFKEQEVSLRELQNRLKISATETKLLSLKIESLKVENLKLRAEASDYSRVAAELEMHKKNMTLLETKLKSVGEQAKDKITALHTRIAELIGKERQDLGNAVDVEKKLKMFNKLEDEVMEVRTKHSRLKQEKLAIIKKVDSEHTLNPSVIRSPDSVLKSLGSEILEEQNQMREENENLKKKLEQLQTDRCKDVEELIYLRWINACLRYELRNYQPPPGRTIARDLSRCLSHKSEQKVKQLILEYSNSGFNLDHSSLMDFDLDNYSSQDFSEESNETSLDSSKTKSSKSRKLNFFGKLKKLALGKDHNADKMMSNGSDINSERMASVSTCTIEESRRKSFDCSSGFSVEKANSSPGMKFYENEKWHIKRNHSLGLSRSSIDIQNLRRLNLEEFKGGINECCSSDLGAVYDHKRMLSLDGNLSSSTCSSSVDNLEEEKMKLKKFAQVFKDSKGSIKFRR